MSDITEDSHYREHDASRPGVTLSPPGGVCRHTSNLRKHEVGLLFSKVLNEGLNVEDEGQLPRLSERHSESHPDDCVLDAWMK